MLDRVGLFPDAWKYEWCEGVTRNSSGDEMANVNFLYDDIVHVHVLQNTIDSCINSATDRRGGYVLERMFTKFSEITQCDGHYAVQGHSRSPNDGRAIAYSEHECEFTFAKTQKGRWGLYDRLWTRWTK